MKSKLCILSLVLGGSLAQAQKPEVTINGFFDTYYSSNLNNPKQTAGLSATSVSSAAIPTGNNNYRYYDIYHNQFTMSLAELSLKAAVDEVSFVADLDFGPFCGLKCLGFIDGGDPR